MPVRDYSLKLSDAFFKEMKCFLENIISNQKTSKNQNQNQNQSQNQNQNQSQNPNTFCQFLLEKYKDCATQTQTPETICKPEMEVIYLTHCANILENEVSNNTN